MAHAGPENLEAVSGSILKSAQVFTMIRVPIFKNSLALKNRFSSLRLAWVFIMPQLLILGMAHTSHAQQNLNGFVVKNPLVAIEHIRHGGPPKDGIPALDKPVFIKGTQVTKLKPSDRVLGLVYHGEIKAYPIRILDHHEIVNDLFGQRHVVISFCPLCGTGMGFDATIKSAEFGEKILNFGVSGLLYNSDVLMYDRQTHSLWSQIDQLAISGPMKGERLNSLPIEHTTWADWYKRHPDSKVLSFDTGHARNYRNSPYAGYENSESLYFPVSHQDKRYHPKEITLGLEVHGVFKAYPFSELGKTTSPLSDTVNGLPLMIHFNIETLSGRVEDMDSKPYPVLSAYWFAWFAFHPETEVFKGK